MRYLPRLISFVAAFVLVAISFTGGSPVAAASPLILPTGFVDEPAFSGLLAPRAFTFMQDGSVLALERGSASSNDSNFSSVRIFNSNGVLQPTRVLTLNTCGDAERGALGIAVDPSFDATAGTGYIYIYYTRQSTVPGDQACEYDTFLHGKTTGPRNRISRFTVTGDVADPASEIVLIDSIITDVGYHNAGDLHFGLDGYLYASSGEGGLSWTSGRTDTLNGKIIRIKPTAGLAGGYTTTGNPYDTATGARNCSAPASIGAELSPLPPCKEIFAKGFRNPFRFGIQPNLVGIPGAGSPFVGDVGGGAWEEINQVQSGGDYGHPVREGYCPGGVVCQPPYQYGGVLAGYNNPIYAYPHVVVNANFDSAVIGGDFYTGTANYPAAYFNNYFFADFARGFIARMVYTNGQWIRQAQNFASGGSGIIGLKRGPDGNLYYLSFTTETSAVDGVRRIRYTGATNQRPTAQISVNPQSGPLSTTYTFSAAGTTDPENNLPFTYNWDFGDSTPVVHTTTPTTTHVYQAAQNYVATLTVTDHGTPPAISLPATVTVYPGNTAPGGSMVLTNTTTPALTTTYYAGDVWNYSASNLTDDVALPANAVSWEIVFHHQHHTHPFIPVAVGNSGQFTIPNTGELDPVVWYRVHLYITDSRGQRTEVIQDIHPVTQVLTFDSIPPNGTVTIEGATFPTPLTRTRVVGMHFSVTVPSPQTILGHAYTFQSWSQGGTQQQTIVVPPADTTYMINFLPPKNYFTTNTPTLTWNPISWAISYDVQISKNAAFTNTPTLYHVGNNLTFTPSTALNDGQYFWRVRACSSASCGTWSAADTFIVDGP